MGAMFSMGLAVLIWSLYPLAAASGLKTMNGLELLVSANLFAALGALIITPLYLIRRKLLSRFIAIHKTLNKRGFIMIGASVFTNIACHACFFVALTMAHKGGVSIIYEMWPIMALIATPFLMRKKWKIVSLADFIVSLLGLVGIAFIVVSTESISLPFIEKNEVGKSDYLSLFGYVIAFVGAYTCALAVVFKGVVGEYFEDLGDPMASSLIAEVYTRVLGVLLLGLSFFFYKDFFDINAINWSASFFVGFVVMITGGALYTLSLLMADRPTIHIVYYFVPILAVVWLYIAGETTINTGLVIGASIITFSNVYLGLTARKAPIAQVL